MHKTIEAMIDKKREMEKKTKEMERKSKKHEEFQSIPNKDAGNLNSEIDEQTLHMMFLDGELEILDYDSNEKIHINKPEYIKNHDSNKETLIEEARWEEINHAKHMEAARIERAITKHNEHMAERRIKRMVKLNEPRPPWNPRPRLEPFKYVSEQLDRPVTPIDRKEKRKTAEKNIKKIYGGKMMKFDVMPTKTISLTDRQIQAYKTNMSNKMMKKRLLNVKAKVSSFRERVMVREDPFYKYAI